MADAETRRQVARQCQVVVHLASNIRDIFSDHERLFLTMGEEPAFDGLAESVGRRSAHLMEALGNALNGMDAVTTEDSWADPIFKEAQKRWPATPESQP